MRMLSKLPKTPRRAHAPDQPVDFRPLAERLAAIVEEASTRVAREFEKQQRAIRQKNPPN